MNKGKEALLAWVQHQLEGKNREIKITNFGEDWADGRAFCALLQRFFPAEVPDSLFGEFVSPKERLETAFQLAQSKLAISPLLDPSSFSQRPQVLLTITFVF